MSAFRKKCLTVCSLALGGFAAFVWAFVLLFRRFPALFDCFARKAAGIYCPACGCSRAVVTLLAFDVPGFVYRSPALAVLCVILLWLAVTVAVAFVKDSCEPIRKFPYKCFWLVFAAAILTCLVRNIALTFGVDFLGDILTVS